MPFEQVSACGRKPSVFGFHFCWSVATEMKRSNRPLALLPMINPGPRLFERPALSAMTAQGCRNKSMMCWRKRESAKKIWRNNSRIQIRTDRRRRLCGSSIEHSIGICSLRHPVVDVNGTISDSPSGLLQVEGRQPAAPLPASKENRRAHPASDGLPVLRSRMKLPFRYSVDSCPAE